MNKILLNIVDFLHGKKAIILGVVSVVNVYLAKQGVESVNMAALVQSILLLVGGSADIATQKFGVAGERLNASVQGQSDLQGQATTYATSISSEPALGADDGLSGLPADIAASDRRK